MQRSRASAQGAAFGRQLYRPPALILAALVVPFVLPGSVWSQRSGRNSRWRNTTVSSGTYSRSAGEGTPWSEMQPAPDETVSINERSTQQLDTMQRSFSPSSVYGNSPSHDAQQAWYTVAPQSTFSGSPVLHKRPTTAAASSYSSRNSVDRSRLPSYAPFSEAAVSLTSSGTAPALFVASQRPNEIPFDNVGFVERLNTGPAAQASSASSVQAGRTSVAAQIPLPESPSTPVTGGGVSTSAGTRAWMGNSFAGDAMLGRSIPSSTGRARAQPAFSPTSFNSANSSGSSTASAVSSAFRASPSTSIITPWVSTVQQQAGVSSSGGAGRGTPSVVQYGTTGVSISEGQRTEATRQSMQSPDQRLWMAGTASIAHGSENARSPDTGGVRAEGAAPTQDSATYIVRPGIHTPRTHGSEPQVAVSSQTSANAESRSYVTRTSRLNTTPNDRSGSSSAEQTVSSEMTQSTTAPTSVQVETTSPVWLSRESPGNVAVNTTLADRGSTSALHPFPSSRWSATLNTVNRPLLQGEDHRGPGDHTLKDTLPQGHDDPVSKQRRYRNEDPPTLLTQESSLHSAETGVRSSTFCSTGHQCTGLQAESDAIVRAGSSLQNNRAIVDVSQPLEDSAESLSLPLIKEQLPPLTEQSGPDLRHRKVSADVAETGVPGHSASLDKAVDTRAAPSKVERPDSTHAIAKGSESRNDELNVTPLVGPQPQDKETGTVDDAVQHDIAKMMDNNPEPLAANDDVSEQRAGHTAAQDPEVSMNDGSTEGAHSRHVLAGYIPADALASSRMATAGNDLVSNGEQPLYGDLVDYMVDSDDPFLKSLSSVEQEEEMIGSFSVTTTSTMTTQTYPPFYNPYSDNLDVDDIPDSPYHNYKWAVDPFPSTYSTHSRLENYESEFNNRYYHEEKTAPNITWEEYTRRRKEVDDARKREAELQSEGSIGLLESSDSLFQGLIGYPSRGRMSRLPV